MLRLATSEQSSEWSVAANMTGCTNTIGDDASFEFDLLVISVVASKSSQRGYSLVMAISSHEPTRRLWQEEHEAREESAEHDLEGDWETPCEIRWAWWIGKLAACPLPSIAPLFQLTVAGSEINPVCNQSSNSNDGAFDTDQ